MSRKLASLQRIVNVEDITFINDSGVEETAANIVKITVLGWELVTQRSNGFKVGDLVVYHEIDSLLPASIEAYGFLRKRDTETEFRLKTVRFKGQISQGLVLPINALFEPLSTGQLFQPTTRQVADKEEGFDLTEVLKIGKYDPEDPAQAAKMSGKNAGLFPSFIPKTDETRIQAVPFVLERRKKEPMFVTEKLDGSSTTVFYTPRDFPGVPKKLAESESDWVFGVCSRNLTISESADNAFWSVVRNQNAQEKIIRLSEKLKIPLALQGELIGPGVQKNKLKLSKLDIRWFNVFDPSSGKFFDYELMMEILGNELELPSVPVLETNVELDFTVPELVKKATRKSVINTDVWAEGSVWRPMVESQEKHLGRFSFKVINPEFSLKYGE